VRVLGCVRMLARVRAWVCLGTRMGAGENRTGDFRWFFMNLL